MVGKKNIVLVGFMGSGKSSVGKILGKLLKRPVVDIDRRIEEREKRKISEIFEKDGEAFFRSLEKEAIRETAAQEGRVITTGGGAVLDPENVSALKEKGCLVALSAEPETILRRVRNSRRRPLLKGDDLLSEIRRLLEIRKPYYELADFHFATDGKSALAVARQIVETLEKSCSQ